MGVLKARYYDHPEGKDIAGKMIATNSYAAAAGFAWSIFDVLMVSHPKGYIPTIGRFAYNIGPMAGMASAFTLTTYMANNVRGKDDRINYFLGGLAAGGVYGAWKRSHIAGLMMGLAFGIAGIVKKTSIIEDWEFFPDLKQHAFMTVKLNDYTLMRDRPKNYTTGKDDE